MKDSFRFSGKWTLNKIYGNTWAFSVKEKAWWRWRRSLCWSEGKKRKKKAWSELVAWSPDLRRRRLGGGGGGGGGGGFGETLLGGGKGRERGRRRSAGRKEGRQG
ncbi:hypothetical protein TIFTF001_012273 [Ficus carica]|uniref:Uncharacterized protein n=1 Tax=Ficus carica TaxID=3494 RepID=A0AA88D3J8_FICCA|nr:hypothetical protein TIFTF001_012273 [Ficus carica]